MEIYKGLPYFSEGSQTARLSTGQSFRSKVYKNPEAKYRVYSYKKLHERGLSSSATAVDPEEIRTTLKNSTLCTKYSDQGK